jgi:hypothetical protein
VRQIAAKIAKQIVESPAWADMYTQIESAASAISRGLADSVSLRAVQRALDESYGTAQGNVHWHGHATGEAPPVTPIVGTLDATLSMPEINISGTYTPPESSGAPAQNKTADNMLFVTFVATVTQAVDSVINDTPEDASRSIALSLAIVLAWWLWNRPRPS